MTNKCFGDGDMDQEDFGRFQICLTANNQPLVSLRCEPGRMDADVDQADLTLFKKCHTAPGVPADPDCRTQ